MELIISQKIHQYRREKGITQEELASALGVTAQAVSHWERGGYPDITLLPNIANYFGVTIDALMGNDEQSEQADLKNYLQRSRQLYREGASLDEALKLNLSYHRKYNGKGSNGVLYALAVIRTITAILAEDFSRRQELFPLLKETADVLMDTANCHHAVAAITEFVPEEELYPWLLKCPGMDMVTRKQVLIERYCLWDQPEKQKSVMAIDRYERIADMLLTAIRKQDTDCVINRLHLSLLDGLRVEGILPDGWSWWYAMTVFLLAGGLFARGEKEEGWEKFGQAMEIYARWQSFPADAKLELGSAELFDGFLLTRIEGYLTKSAETRIEIRDGALYAYDLQQVDNMTIQEVFFPPFSVSDILRNHPAFASVREDERLIRALEWLESDDSR